MHHVQRAVGIYETSGPCQRRTGCVGQGKKYLNKYRPALECSDATIARRALIVNGVQAKVSGAAVNDGINPTMSRTRTLRLYPRYDHNPSVTATPPREPPIEMETNTSAPMGRTIQVSWCLHCWCII
jgi:hypothetical protein